MPRLKVYRLRELRFGVRTHFAKSSPELKFLLLIILSLSFISSINARKLDDIYWNSSNPMFDISNTQHVKSVKLLDRVTIVCPRTVHSNQRYEFTKLFMVSREAYERCELPENGKNARQFGVCATPHRQSTISIVFRPFSALSSGLQFRPGHSYYVITTSDGTERGLNKSFGGLCLTRNMKMKFDVLPDDFKSDERIDDDDENAFSITDNRLLTASTAEKPSDREILYEIHTSDSVELPAIVAPMTNSMSSIFQGALHRTDDDDAQKLESKSMRSVHIDKFSSKRLSAASSTNAAAPRFHAGALHTGIALLLVSLSIQFLRRFQLPVIL